MAASIAQLRGEADNWKLSSDCKARTVGEMRCVQLCFNYAIN